MIRLDVSRSAAARIPPAVASLRWEVAARAGATEIRSGEPDALEEHPPPGVGLIEDQT
jgi:hypothetical protein